MKSIFLDSSVLVAASASTAGASAFILGLSRTNKILSLTSMDVLREAKKNIEQKFDLKAVKRFLFYLNFAHLVIIQLPEPELVYRCERYIHPKDAPILAAALNSSAEYIISLDKKHFFKKSVIDFVKPKIIITPSDFVKYYRSAN